MTKNSMQLFSWGNNSHGQLSQYQIEQILVPAPVNITVNVKLIVGGGKHTVIVTSNGEILTCGDNDKGQLGKELEIPSANIFELLPCPYKIRKVSCGWDFNLALTESNEVLGWGSNKFGQLGLSTQKTTHITSPYKIFEHEAIGIGTGLRHSAVIRFDGLLFTCGFGRKGQLGYHIENNIPTTSDKFTLVPNLCDCQEISCGENHCIIKTSYGKFFSWGDNRFGQLGVDPILFPSVSIPKQIDLKIKNLVKTSLFSGWAHNLVLTEEGELIIWGRCDFGQLGEERKINWKPQKLKILYKIKQVSTGSHHCVALTESGDVLTWGWNEHGNCGNGNTENLKMPFKLKNFDEIVNLMADETFDVLEIEDSNLKVLDHDSELTEIPIIGNNVKYSNFFNSFLLPNKPCIIKNISGNWPCTLKWIENETFNIQYFKYNYKNTEVPISNCKERDYNVQKKLKMKLFDYIKYWEERKTSKESLDCLYLKDWHFFKEFPDENVYRVPHYFASDWLNEYYDNCPELQDDYRFIYIGPKNSWTPFHADVFTSFSWSVNVIGRKKWLLIPPGAEDHFRDASGNLNYDINLSDIDVKQQKFSVFEVIQEEQQGLFIPSGWHHQEDTVSINHNWINGCNINRIWDSLKKHLAEVMKEIADCKEMENWNSQCQLVLSASFGMNYGFFYDFLTKIATSRIEALKSEKNLSVYGNWFFGKNHMIFDLKQILTVMHLLEKDENFIEVAKVDKFNHSLEFIDCLNTFLIN